MSKKKLCKLFLLTDCAVSVQLSEQMFFGNVMSDLTVCDGYKDESEFAILRDIQSGSQNGINDIFYKIYTSLTMVMKQKPLIIALIMIIHTSYFTLTP